MCTFHLAYFKSDCQFMRVRHYQGRTDRVVQIFSMSHIHIERPRCSTVRLFWQMFPNEKAFKDNEKHSLCNKEYNWVQIAKIIVLKKIVLNGFLLFFVAFDEMCGLEQPCIIQYFKVVDIKVVLTYKVEDLYRIFYCCGFSDLSCIVV